MALVFPSSPTTGQVFNPGPGLPTWMWDGTKWTNATTPPLKLESLSDVALAGAVDGRVLAYNATAGHWVNSGQVGTPPNVALAWDDSGHYGFGGLSFTAPIPRLIINGDGNSDALHVFGGWATVADRWVARFNASSGGSSGMQNGLQVTAGGNSSDWSLQTVNMEGGMGFGVRGDNKLFATNLTQSTTSYPVYWGAYGTGEFTFGGSAARFKTDIRTVSRDRARKTVAALRAITFRSRCEADDPTLTHYGFIAEEVAAVDPRLVLFNKEGEPMMVQYDRIAALLLPLVQELLGMDEPEGEVYG